MILPLAPLQSAFQDRLTSNSDDVIAHLADGGRFLNVYQDGYVLRLLLVLAEDFGALHSLLGDEKFEKAMRDYLSDNPSRHPSIRWLGERLSDWLANTLPWQNHKELSDIAAFEWALGLSFDGPDADVLQVSALAEVAPGNWPNLTFGLHPTLHLVDLDYDVVPFQQAIKAERVPESPPTPFEKPVVWAVWRNPDDLTVYHRRLEDDEGAALKAVQGGATFSTMCEILAGTDAGDEAAARAAGMLAQWVNSGWVSSTIIPNAST